MGIDRLETAFHPRSVAVVGASAPPGSPEQAVMANLINGGFKGSVHPTNARHGTVMGRDAHPSRCRHRTFMSAARAVSRIKPIFAFMKQLTTSTPSRSDHAADRWPTTLAEMPEIRERAAS